MAFVMFNFISLGKDYLKIKKSVCWINYENSILNKKILKNISKYFNLNDIELFKLYKTFDNKKVFLPALIKANRAEEIE